MDETLSKLVGALPEHWRNTAIVLAIASPYISRAIQSLRTGGGLRGMLSGIWLGTNQPKPPEGK
jgi:hypothetical protein